MAAKLPDLAPLEAATAGLEMALHRLESALRTREDMHRGQHLAMAERLERVIAGIEPLIGAEPAMAPRGRKSIDKKIKRRPEPARLLEDA